MLSGCLPSCASAAMASRTAAKRAAPSPLLCNFAATEPPAAHQVQPTVPIDRNMQAAYGLMQSTTQLTGNASTVLRRDGVRMSMRPERLGRMVCADPRSLCRPSYRVSAALSGDGLHPATASRWISRRRQL